MQLEQQEYFEIQGPQLEVFGEIESKLPAPVKKRSTAALVLAVLALVSVVGIGGARLKGEYREVKAQYTAVDEYGHGIQGDFTAQVDAAASLIRQAGDVLGEEDDTVIAAAKALDLWNADADADKPNVQYELNRHLYGTVDTMFHAALGQADADKADRMYGLYDTFTSAQATIDRTGAAYNEAVKEYEKTASGFPAGLLAAVWGADDLQAFA